MPVRRVGLRRAPLGAAQDRPEEAPWVLLFRGKEGAKDHTSSGIVQEPGVNIGLTLPPASAFYRPVSSLPRPGMALVLQQIITLGFRIYLLHPKDYTP